LLKIYLERTQLFLHFTPFQKEELVISPISRISVIETVFLFHVIQTFTEMSAAARQEGLFTCTIAKRPGINTRMCVMLFGVLKASVPLGVHARPQQGLCPVISLRSRS
jgi:hypothetical protein